MPRSWTAPSTAIMIRDHLAKGEDYPYHIWRTIEAQVKALNHRKKKPYVPPSWNSTRSMIYVLKQLGLITGPRRVVSERGRKAASTATNRGHTFPDRLIHLYYYKLNPERVRDEKWESPFEALYRPEAFKARSTRGVASKMPPVESRRIRPEWINMRRTT